MSTTSCTTNLTCLKQSDHFPSILRSAIASRLLLLTLILLWRSLLTPYDTSASLKPTCLSSDNSGDSRKPIRWPSIASAIEDSIVWDSVYFVRIAECGYEYEQSYAFLPLLPICISLLSQTIFAPLVSLIGHRAVLGLSGYVINNIAFVLAAVYFYRLSIIILKDPEAAYRASILFCFNPASIFYTSIYTESLYALFSLGGLYHLTSGADNLAMLSFAASGSARSNGVLNAGYFGYHTMHQAYNAMFIKRNVYLAVQVLVTGALRCLCIFVPFIAFQAYGYYNICLGNPNSLRTWCKARPPLLYNHIQTHYWGVGFLRYFQLKQLPNFLLASPILCLAICTVVHYVKLRPEIFLSLGFHASFGTDPRSSADYLSEKSSINVQRDHTVRHRKQKIMKDDPVAVPVENDSLNKPGYSSFIVLPFVLHLGFMAATAFFVMHVQVATRFLSANPPLYWFASCLMLSPAIGMRWGYLIWAYSVAYILLGSLLFSNFYPFT